MASRKTEKRSTKREKRSTRKNKRKGSPWTDLVKKVHMELKKKNKNASLGDAMKEASKRKSEMKK
jgi:hypothetical protein